MKALMESGQLDLTAAFDASANPYMLLTPDLRYAGMNQAYLDTTGATREALLGRSIFEVFDAGPASEAQENARQLRASFEKVLTTGERDHLALIHYALPEMGPDGDRIFRDRYWAATHTPIKNPDGSIRYILQHTTDITELHLLRQRQGADHSPAALDAMIGGGLLERAEQVQADNRRLDDQRRRLTDVFMQTPGFIAVLSGPDHVFEMHNDAYAQLIGHRDITGLPLAQGLPEIEEQGFVALLNTVRATGEPFEGKQMRVALQRTPGGAPEEVYLDFIYQPIRDGDGQVQGVFVQGHEVTETVLAQQRQRLMIDELNHRVKNTLATVQSIAMQTARSETDPLAFAQAFQARLLSLSHTHDLLTRSHWEGAELAEVLEHETAAHGARRVLLNGPPVSLDATVAVSLGMIFHELATNAAKYGALSSGDGLVTVDWRLADHQKPRLLVEWREHGGPPVEPPQRRGFGSRLIERSVRHDLAGEARLSYHRDGFVAEIDFPLDRGRG